MKRVSTASVESDEVNTVISRKSIATTDLGSVWKSGRVGWKVGKLREIESRLMGHLERGMLRSVWGSDEMLTTVGVSGSSGDSGSTVVAGVAGVGSGVGGVQV